MNLKHKTLLRQSRLFQKAILHKNFNPWFWKSRTIFLKKYFLLVATIFLSCGYLFEMIFAF